MKKRRPTALNKAQDAIRNLESLLRHTNSRLEEMRVDRDVNYNSAKEWRSLADQNASSLETARQYRKADVFRLEECQAKLASTECKLEGYRLAIKDIVGS